MHVEIHIEEYSALVALEILLPRILPAGVTYALYDMGGKDRLLANLPARLKAYRAWRPEGCRVVVLVDRDDDDCRVLKQRLEAIAAAAGLPTRTSSPAGFFIVNRTIVEELEAWFLGDVPALVAAYPRVSATLAEKAPFRDPDAIAGGTWEALERVLRRAGYHQGGLAKIEAARAIAAHMRPEHNRSGSFQAFRAALCDLCGEPFRNDPTGR